MSRTRKDTPVWVRARDPKERRVAYHRQVDYGHLACWQECTIETSSTADRAHLRYVPCEYFIDVSMNWHNTPSRKDRRDAFHGPIRGAERAYARTLSKAYNSGADVEDYDDASLYNVGDEDMRYSRL